MSERYDAVVVGAGPNGLAAAVAIARAGRSVLVVEAKETIGGGARTMELTLPGFRHDVCSAIHPMARMSAFLRQLPLAEHGLSFVDPPACLAHPLDDGSAAVLERSIDATVETLGPDARAWRRVFEPFARAGEGLFDELLRPLRLLPRHPITMLRFGLRAFRSAVGVARGTFEGPHARALFAGNAAHSFLPLDAWFSAAFGLVLGSAAHAVGWPIARGGSQAIVDALARYARSLGAVVECGHPVRALSELPPARAYLFDVTPRHLATICADALPAGYRDRLARYRHGPGVFKLDYALDGPIPWRAKACARAGTVHVGGTLEEVAASEAAMGRGEIAERPFVLVAQQSLFDDTRAPAGKHTAWAYCHVPNGAGADMTDRIEAQIERFAPGFRDLVRARHAMGCAAMEAYNASYVGGDILNGANDFPQVFVRPVLRAVPYATPNPAIFLCSAATPPGGGVHGMCGAFAAEVALRRRLGA